MKTTTPDGPARGEKQRVIDIGGAGELKKRRHDDMPVCQRHRLWYVALTRASHRIYALFRMQDHKIAVQPAVLDGAGRGRFFSTRTARPKR